MERIEQKPHVLPTSQQFVNIYERLIFENTNIPAIVNKGLEHEKQGRSTDAISCYEKSVELINETLEMVRFVPEDAMPIYTQWREACCIIKRLRRIHEETNHRLRLLRTPSAVAASDALAASDAYVSIECGQGPEKSFLTENPLVYGEGSLSTTTEELENIGKSYYRKIVSNLRQIIADPGHDGLLFDTLFQAQTKLYKIQPDGVVFTLGETSMSLVMCSALHHTEETKYLNGVCFIQCTIATQGKEIGASENVPTKESPQMIWLYLLLPAVTNCFRTNYGAFILPDMEVDEAGHAFGLMLFERSDSAVGDAADAAQKAEELDDLNQFFLDLLEAVLASDVELLKKEIPQRKPRDTSEQVSRHIVNAADFIAHNMVRGAEKTGELMYKGTPYIISKINAASPDVPPVSSKVQTTVAVAKNVSQAAAGVTGWMANKVGTASMALGRYLAPYVHTAGTAVLQRGFGYNSAEASSTVEGAMTIAAGAVEGISTVYGGLETSAKILGNNLSANSVKIIEHTYGASAGNVAAGTFDTIGNAFNVSQNVNYITPKGIAKKMAKNTGKAVVSDYQSSLYKEKQLKVAMNPHNGVLEKQ